MARAAGYDAASGHWFAGAQSADVIGQMVTADVHWSVAEGPTRR